MVYREKSPSLVVRMEPETSTSGFQVVVIVIMPSKVSLRLVTRQFSMVSQSF